MRFYDPGIGKFIARDMAAQAAMLGTSFPNALMAKSTRPSTNGVSRVPGVPGTAYLSWARPLTGATQPRIRTEGIGVVSPELPVLEQLPQGEGTNLYLYARNNPLVTIDPMGQGPVRDWILSKIRLVGRGVFVIKYAVACGACGLGTLGIEAICYATTVNNDEFLCCVCDEIERNVVWKVTCNVCFAPVSWFADIKKFFNCD